MISTAAVKKARTLFEGLNSDYLDQLDAREVAVGYVFSEPIDGGRSIIIGKDGGQLYFPATVSVDRAVRAYQDGKRTAREKFGKSREDWLPLQLQSIIHNSRSFAVFFVATYAVSMVFAGILALMYPNNGPATGYFFYYLVMAILHAICVPHLSAEGKTPNTGWLVFTAILAFPTIASIIGILINVSLWSNVSKARKYDKYGRTAFETDEEWSKKNKKPQSLTKQTVLASVLGGGLALIIGGLIFFSTLQADWSDSGATSTSASSLASQAVQDLKQEMTMPYTVDDVTILDDVTANGSVIEYHYTIHDVDSTALTNSVLKDNVKPGVCEEGSQVKVLLDNGISLMYSYLVRETAEQYSFTIYPNEC